MPILRSLIERRSAIGSIENPSTDLYQALTGGLGPVAAGVAVTPQSAMRIGAVFAAVRLIAETIASLPLEIVNTAPGAGREPLRRAGQEYLWRRPNPVHTPQTFWELLIGHALLTGNAYILKVFDGLGRVTELWPLDPAQVRPFWAAPGVKGYAVNGEELPAAHVCHIMAFSRDGLAGLSVVGQARETMGLALAAEQAQANFYGQGSQVTGVLTTEQELSDDQSERIARRWQKRHAGARNAHLPAVLGNGAKWQNVGIPPADAQYLDTRKFTVTEIARIFRIPPHLIGDVERSTSWGTGIEEQNQQFLTYTFLPWLRRFEQAITHDLLPVKDHEARFQTRHLLRAKLKERYQAYQIGITAGWLSKNDVRRMEEMDPIPDGDDYLTTPVGAAPAAPPDDDPPPPPEGQNGDDPA